jgi:hypothetical protein
VRQERHDEMPRLKKVHSLAQAFGAIYIHTGRRRNERRAESDECHVDGSAYGDSRKEGKHISQ